MKNKKGILFFTVVVLLAGVFFIGSEAPKGKNSGEVAKEVRVSYGSIQKFISATGIVQPQNRLEMKAPIGGRVDQILVEEGQQVKAGDLMALMSSTDRAALLDAARSQGEKSVNYWEDVYKPAPIVAPIDGEVIVKSVQPGQTVTTSDAIVVLSDRLIVQAQVDETDIGKVKEGQKAVVSLDAYPDIAVDGTVKHIYYESKTVSNVTIYQVDILPEKVPAVFRSGMSANVRIVEEEKDHVLLAPLEAIQRSKTGNFVLVKTDPGKKPQKQPVTLGISDETNHEIVSGVNENDTLVIFSKKNVAAKPARSAGNPFLPSGGGGRR